MNFLPMEFQGKSKKSQTSNENHWDNPALAHAIAYAAQIFWKFTLLVYTRRRFPSIWLSSSINF